MTRVVTVGGELDRTDLRASVPVRLEPCLDSHFEALLAGLPPSHDLRLPEGELEEVPVLEYLRALTAELRSYFPVGTWLIVVQDELVGFCSYKGAPSPDGDLEIGYGIAASRRDRGYATAAVAQVVRETQRYASIRALTAETAIGNTASSRVLEKNGFLKIGTRRDEEEGELFRWRREL